MHVILNLDVGGAQEVVRTLAKYQAAAGCTPIVCSFQDGPLRHPIERAGIPVKLLPRRHHSIIAFPLFVQDMLHILNALSRLINAHQVDVLQTHLLRTIDFLTPFLRLTTSLQAIFWTFHSANFELTIDHLPGHKWLLRSKRFAHQLLYRLFARWISGFIAVSEQTKDNLISIIGDSIADKITVVPNGVDTSRYNKTINKAKARALLGLPPQAHLMAMVGTLKKVKGHDYTIRAMADLAPKYPNLHALFIGDGELRTELQTQATAANLTDKIHFLGNRNDIPTLLASGDLFVLPSRWEGLSMALLEAMASGLPVAASAVSGTVQVITPGENGLLFPVDDVPSLIEAIEWVISNPQQARKMGDHGRQHVTTNFSAKKQADEHIALYHHLSAN